MIGIHSYEPTSGCTAPGLSFSVNLYSQSTWVAFPTCERVVKVQKPNGTYSIWVSLVCKTKTDSWQYLLCPDDVKSHTLGAHGRINETLWIMCSYYLNHVLPCLSRTQPARFRSQVDHYVMSHCGAVYTDHHQVVPDLHLSKAEYFNDNMLWGSLPNDK